MATLTADSERLLLNDLAPLVAAYGIACELHQDDPGLTPGLHLRHGSVTTYVFIHDGYFCAFLGMPMARVDDPEDAAGRIAMLAGVPGLSAAHADH